LTKSMRNTALYAAGANKNETVTDRLRLGSCLNPLDGFYPRFPFPSFHGSNQVDQPNNLSLAVLLQSDTMIDSVNSSHFQIKD
jgi:hypothetical protein